MSAKKRFVMLLVPVLLMIQASAGCAQDSLKEKVERIVDQYAKPLVDTAGKPSDKQAPGGIVGVYINGETFYFPFGRIDEAGTPPTKDTLFGIGSITKTFTTSILGQREDLFNRSVADGSLPPGYDLQPEEKPVTFEQLATFTGGIVPSVPNCQCEGEGRPVCTQELFVSFINGIKPQGGKLPTPDVYSNSSIGFIGQILMHRDGYKDFGASESTRWFGEHLFSYLGMEHTGAPAKTDPTHPLSVPFGFRAGKYVPLKEYACWVPWGTAGRVFSTAEDMVDFIMANVGVGTIDGKKVPEEVLAGMRQALKPRTKKNDKSSLYQAFAWDVWPEDEKTHSRIRGKAGGITGVSAYVSVNPELQYGVVVLLNMKSIGTQNPTISIMKELRPLAGTKAR